MRALKHLCLGTALMASLLASAVPANRQPRVYTQPDGTEVTLRLIGDEFYHFYLTDDDKMVLADNDGGFYFAEVDPTTGTPSPSSVLAANPGKRNALQLQIASKMDMSLLAKKVEIESAKSPLRKTKPLPGMKKSAPMNASSSDTWVGKGLFSSHSFPTQGSPHVLVILVEYQDKAFTTKNAGDYFRGLLSTPGFSQSNATGSAVDYFRDASNGVFTPQFDVLGPVTLPQNVQYYGGNTNNVRGNDQNAAQMVVDAINILDAQGVDFSVYDTNNDGYLDNVYLIYAGLGEASGGAANTVWPHSWDLYSAGKMFRVDGKYVYKYGCSAEMLSSNLVEGIGTFCHEFGHVIGLPDEYATDYGDADTLHPGDYSIMASGSYNNNGRTPPTYSIFQRNAFGWADVEKLDQTPRTIVMDHTLDTNKGYVIPTSKANEFFLIENRQKKGWDAYLPGHGLLIWHIDYDSDVWDSNNPNDNASHQYIDIVEAGGTANNAKSTTMATYPFPGTANKTSFTDITTPAMKSWSGTALGVPLTNISEAPSTGKVTFDVCGGGIFVQKPTLNASGNMVCDNVFTLTATPDNSADVIKYAMLTDNDILEGTIDGSIDISENCTISVWAERGDVACDETEISFTFKCAAVTISPNGGSYMNLPAVTLSSATTDAVIYYTTDGSTPSTASTRYSGTFTPAASCTVKAIATRGSWAASAVSSAQFTKVEQQSGAQSANLINVWNVTDANADGYNTGISWSSGYNNVVLNYPYMTVKMAASHQTGTIADRPVVKGTDVIVTMKEGCVPIRQFSIELKQWGSKLQTAKLYYTTDGSKYTAIDPEVSVAVEGESSVLTCSSIPAEAIGLKVGFTNSSSQVGITSIAVAYGDESGNPPVVPTEHVAIPVFSPEAGEVESGTEISISCATEGAAIHYTVNGDTPTAQSTLYTVPLAITEATTFKAIAVKEGMLDSDMAEAAYTIKASQEDPTPSEGYTIVYKNMTTTAEINSQTKYSNVVESGDAIASYTSSSKLYEGPNGIRLGTPSVHGTLTLAIASAYQKNYTSVVIKGCLYSSTSATLSVNGGTAQTFTSKDQLDDYTFNLSGDKLTTLELESDGRLYVKSITFVEGTQAPQKPDVPAITVLTDTESTDNTFDEWVMVSFDDYVGSVYYTIDESDPTDETNTSRSLFAETIEFSETTTLKYAGLVDGVYSDVTTIELVKNEPAMPTEHVAIPVFSPEAGEVESGSEISISCATEGAAIHYTVNGDTPTAQSTLYTAPVAITEAATFKAIAVKEGMLDSDMAEAAYTIKEVVVTPPTSSGSFTIVYKDDSSDDSNAFASDEKYKEQVESGADVADLSASNNVYKGKTGLKFSSSKANGSLTLALNPDYQKNVYKVVVKAVQSDSSAKLKVNSDSEQAIGTTLADYEWEIDDSNVLTTVTLSATKRLYVKSITFYYNTPMETVATPVFAPKVGEVESGTEISISCATEGAAIHYTVNGDTPTAESTLYTAPVAITEATTFKAIAVKEGMKPSEVAVAAYTIAIENPGEQDDPIPASIGLFDFTVAKDSDGKGAYGIDVTSDNNTYCTGNAVCNEDGCSITISGKYRLWESTNGSVDLRLYKSSTITVKANQNHKLLNVAINCDKTAGLAVDGNEAATWTGRTDEVTFNCSATTKVTSIDVEVLQVPTFGFSSFVFNHDSEKNVTFCGSLHKENAKHVKSFRIWLVEVDTPSASNVRYAAAAEKEVGSITIPGNTDESEIAFEIPLDIEPGSGVHSLKVRTQAKLYDNSSAMSEHYSEGEIEGSTNEFVYDVDTDKSSDTTGLESILSGNSNADVEYYNLQGIRIENPTPGVYIRRQGSSLSKVVLK